MNLLHCYDEEKGLQEMLASLKANKEVTKATGLLLSKAVDYACLALGRGKRSHSEFLLSKILPSLPTFIYRCFALAFDSEGGKEGKAREVFLPLGVKEQNALLLRLLDLGCLFIRHNSELGFVEYLFRVAIPRSFQVMLSWITWNDGPEEEDTENKKKAKGKGKGKTEGKDLRARQDKQIQLLTKVTTIQPHLSDDSHLTR